MVEPLTRLVDQGIKKEIEDEFRTWNTRDNIERFPLSPSQIGKCGLMLARNLAHVLGIADYPRNVDSRSPRIQRIFNRGHLLESSLIADIEKYTSLKIEERQKVVTLHHLSADHAVKGSIDGIVVTPEGKRIVIDFKSKGAFYSAGFGDSVGEFFADLKETGLVIDHGANCFEITDVKALFDQISLDEFFVDYLLQLNSYAFSEELRGTIDFVALYYENKNTCMNYEVRWVPSEELFKWGNAKMQFVYDTVRSKGPEHVDKEFPLGSARCKLCDYNTRCYGDFTPKPREGVVKGPLGGELDTRFITAVKSRTLLDAVSTEVLAEMEKRGLTHITTSGGITYERKFLKSPKPHYELRLTRG